MISNQRVSQWQVLRNDKWLLSCLSWIPILLAISIWWIFSQGVARSIDFAVVDLDHSSLSRQLTREFDATSSLSISYTFQSPKQAKEALVRGDIYAYAIIPNNYSRDITIGNTPSVSVFYNSQYILIGKLITSAVQQAHGTFTAQIGIIKQLSKGNTPVNQALATTANVRNQIVPLFNSNSNYAQFLVTAIIPALWQILIIVCTILVLTANHRVNGLNRMLGTRPMFSALAIMTWYIPIYLLMGVGFLSWFYFGLGWPMEGSFLALVYSQFITILACIIMGGFFFFLTLDAARAMSFAGAFTAPSFAFMGVTFPVTDMSITASAWRSLLPVTHYIEAQIAQLSYGVTSFQTISTISTGMVGYMIPLFLIYPLCKKHLSKLEQNR